MLKVMNFFFIMLVIIAVISWDNKSVDFRMRRNLRRAAVVERLQRVKVAFSECSCAES